MPSLLEEAAMDTRVILSGSVPDSSLGSVESRKSVSIIPDWKEECERKCCGGGEVAWKKT